MNSIRKITGPEKVRSMKKALWRVLAVLLAVFLAMPCAWAAEEDCYTVLLMGEGDSTQELAATGYAASEAILVASVNLQTGAIRLLSVDGDLLSYDGETPLSHTTRLGTPDRTIRAVNELYGLSIERYIHVDIAGLGDIVRILGGVEMDIQASDMIYTENGELFAEIGTQVVSADQMVQYVSAHEGDDDGARSARHRKALSAIYARLMTGGMAAAIDFASIALQYMETNITGLEVSAVGAALFRIGILEPKEARSPMTQFSRMATKEFEVIVCDEMDAERAMVQRFLFE